KEVLCAPGYLRYVDDLLVFDQDKKWLHDCTKRVREFLCYWRLHLNPKKAVIYPVKQGIPFLGFWIFPTHRRILRYGVKRARQRLRGLSKGYRLGQISWEKVNASVQAWLGHVNHGDTWGLRQALLHQYTFSRGP
ncbi:MAG: reverse transcriptase domain-containing protein, partial [bacterium]